LKIQKKCVFNTFGSFLAFLALSQKNLNFQRHLERVQLLTRYFLKSLIFLFESMLILVVFKKIQKNKKNQNLQKERS